MSARKSTNSGKTTKFRRALLARADRVRFHRRARAAAFHATWAPTAFDSVEQPPPPPSRGEHP